MAHMAYTRNSMFLSSWHHIQIQSSFHPPTRRSGRFFFSSSSFVVVFVPGWSYQKLSIDVYYFFVACTIYNMFIPSKFYFVMYVRFSFLLFFMTGFGWKIETHYQCGVWLKRFLYDISVLLIVWWSDGLMVWFSNCYFKLSNIEQQYEMVLDLSSVNHDQVEMV